MVKNHAWVLTFIATFVLMFRTASMSVTLFWMTAKRSDNQLQRENNDSPQS